MVEEKRGKLIVIEGTDCSGKSTQINLLLEQLKKENISAASLDFPNYSTPTGKIVRRYLDNEFGPANQIDPKIASIFYAEDRFASKSIIEEALIKNQVVILDRYVESNMGHQGGKIRDENERRKFFEWLKELEYENFQMHKPDLIIFFHMPHLVSIELKGQRTKKSEFHPSRDDGHENIEHLKNAEEAYLQLANLYGWVKISWAPDRTINSLRTPEDISEEVYEHIIKVLNYAL